jgi:hypothetical protein
LRSPSACSAPVFGRNGGQTKVTLDCGAGRGYRGHHPRGGACGRARRPGGRTAAGGAGRAASRHLCRRAALGVGDRARTDQRPYAPVPESARAGVLGPDRQRPSRGVPGPGRQRLRRQGQLGRLPAAGLPDPAALGASRRRARYRRGARLCPVPRSGPPGRLADRQPGNRRAIAHRGRLRPRVDRAGARRHLLGR